MSARLPSRKTRVGTLYGRLEVHGRGERLQFVTRVVVVQEKSRKVGKDPEENSQVNGPRRTAGGGGTGRRHAASDRLTAGKLRDQMADLQRGKAAARPASGGESIEARVGSQQACHA